MNKNKVIIKKYNGAPPYGHCFWLPGKNDHTFSCTETLLNTITLLLRPRFFGLLVTLLTGFHCALLREVVDVSSIIIENDRWWSLFFPQRACCERIVKWCKLTIKEGDQGNERKTKVICKYRLSGVASVSGWVRRESWDDRNEKGRGGEIRKLFPLHRVNRRA